MPFDIHGRGFSDKPSSEQRDLNGVGEFNSLLSASQIRIFIMLPSNSSLRRLSCPYQETCKRCYCQFHHKSSECDKSANVDLPSPTQEVLDSLQFDFSIKSDQFQKLRNCLSVNEMGFLNEKMAAIGQQFNKAVTMGGEPIPEIINESAFVIEELPVLEINDETTTDIQVSKTTKSAPSNIQTENKEAVSIKGASILENENESAVITRKSPTSKTREKPTTDIIQVPRIKKECEVVTRELAVPEMSDESTSGIIQIPRIKNEREVVTQELAVPEISDKSTSGMIQIPRIKSEREVVTQELTIPEISDKSTSGMIQDPRIKNECEVVTRELAVPKLSDKPTTGLIQTPKPPIMVDPGCVEMENKGGDDVVELSAIFNQLTAKLTEKTASIIDKFVSEYSSKTVENDLISSCRRLRRYLRSEINERCAKALSRVTRLLLKVKSTPNSNDNGNCNGYSNRLAPVGNLIDNLNVIRDALMSLECGDDISKSRNDTVKAATSEKRQDNNVVKEQVGSSSKSSHKSSRERSQKRSHESSRNHTEKSGGHISESRGDAVPPTISDKRTDCNNAVRGQAESSRKSSHRSSRSHSRAKPSPQRDLAAGNVESRKSTRRDEVENKKNNDSASNKKVDECERKRSYELKKEQDNGSCCDEDTIVCLSDTEESNSEMNIDASPKKRIKSDELVVKPFKTKLYTDLFSDTNKTKFAAKSRIQVADESGGPSNINTNDARLKKNQFGIQRMKVNLSIPHKEISSKPRDETNRDFAKAKMVYNNVPSNKVIKNKFASESQSPMDDFADSSWCKQIPTQPHPYEPPEAKLNEDLPVITTKQRVSHVKDNLAPLFMSVPTKRKLPSPRRVMLERYEANHREENPSDIKKPKSASSSSVSSSYLNNAKLKNSAPSVKQPVDPLQDAHRPIICHPPDGSLSNRIPPNIRQFYLDKLFLAYSEKYDLPTASSKALAEEEKHFQKVKLPQIYKKSMAVFIATIKKLSVSKIKDMEEVRSDYPSELHGQPIGEIARQFILTKDQMEENGYPIRIADGCYRISKNARYYRPMEKKRKSETEYYCSNCNQLFDIAEVLTETACTFHSKRLKVEYRGKFSCGNFYECCDGDANHPGCVTNKYHAPDTLNEDSMFGFIQMNAVTDVRLLDRNPFYAVDCEMVYTTFGVELARISVVDHQCNTVYDEYVVPDNEILDYCTRYSGITEENLKNASKRLEDIHNDLRSFIFQETILVGHSLENDLKVLKIAHWNVVDTSVLFPSARSKNNKFPLKFLAQHHCNLIIQEDENGHDSADDANACVRLLWVKMKERAAAYKQKSIISGDIRKNAH